MVFELSILILHLLYIFISDFLFNTEFIEFNHLEFSILLKLVTFRGWCFMELVDAL